MNSAADKNISDEDLLERCFEGERWAWELFYERFSNVVSTVIKVAASRYRFVFSKEDFGDCSQSVWASFLEKDFKKLRQWKKECRLSTFIRVCTYNSAINFFNRICKQNSIFISVEGQCFSGSLVNLHAKLYTHKKVIAEEELDKVIQFIEKELSPRERLFSRLYWFEGNSYQEISQIMNIPKANLHLIKYRIQKKLKNSFSVQEFQKVFR